MKADVYVELPSTRDAAPKIGVRKGQRIEAVSLSELRANGQTKAIAFAPALSVARFRVPVTAKSESEARKAALFAVEDDIAQPVEDVLLTLAPRRNGDSNRDVYIVDKSLMASWQATLRSINLGHAPIIPENSFALGESAVVNFGDRVLLKSGTQSFGADCSLPQDAIDALIDSAGLSGTRTIRADALTFLSELHGRDQGVVLAGSGRDAAQQNASGARFWRAAVGLTVAALVLWFGSLWADSRAIESAISKNEVAARTMFRTQFPGAPEPDDIHMETRRQAQQLLAGGSGAFRPLTAGLYQAIAGSETVRLVRMSYMGLDRALKADLQFANRADEASLYSRHESGGWNVEPLTSADLPQGVEASIVLRAQQ